LTIVVEVAAALQYAHEGRGRDGRPMGLIHRDVSPSNVMVGFGGEVKLVDFGIAKATELTNGTQSGAIKGKLRYMSPEQARGETLDNRSDIFSLGILAYELTIGERCFCAEGEFALINRVATGRFDLPSARRVDYPPELERIIVRAMAPQPEQRFPEARSFQLAIERYAAQQGISLSKPQLGEYMRRLFDASPFPTTASIPDVTELGPTTKDATDRSVRSSHPRRRLPVAIAALGIGLAIGVGTGRLDAAWEQPRTEAPAVERDVGSAVAPPPVGRTDMPVPISTAPRRPDEEARESSIVSTPTDAERDAVPSTTPGKSVSKSKSSSEHRRTRREPRAKQPRAETKGGPSGAEAPPMNAEYLPPSMRGRGTP
jgi:serine/threonine-protein kinase